MLLDKPRAEWRGLFDPWLLSRTPRPRARGRPRAAPPRPGGPDRPTPPPPAPPRRARRTGTHPPADRPGPPDPGSCARPGRAAPGPSRPARASRVGLRRAWPGPGAGPAGRDRRPVRRGGARGVGRGPRGVDADAAMLDRLRARLAGTFGRPGAGAREDTCEVLTAPPSGGPDRRAVVVRRSRR